MKKVLASIAAAAVVAVPAASFALESMNTKAMKKATGQAGVSIGLDNIVIYMSSQPTTTYWDNDGMSSGYLGNTGGPTDARTGLEISYNAAAEKLITIGAVLDASKYGVSVLDGAGHFNGAITAAGMTVGIAEGTANNNLDVTTGKMMDTASPANFTNAQANGSFVSGISPLTIDLGACQALTQGLNYNIAARGTAQHVIAAGAQIVGVVIGLPTVEITQFHTSDTKSLKIVSANVAALNGSAGAAGSGLETKNELISIQKSGTQKIAILGGRLEIAPH